MIRLLKCVLVMGALISIGGLFVVSAADVHVGGVIHPWFGYPSEGLSLDVAASYTLGPSLTFSAGPLSCTLWYGIDANRTGYLCVQDSFGVPSGELSSLAAILQEIGWRISSSGPAFLSASVSRLRWSATGLCDESIGSSLTSTQIAAGGGLRIGSFWACAEYGVRWTNATPDFEDVDPSPEGQLNLSFGLETRVNPISSDVLRYSVSSFPIAFEESFPIGCDRWFWEGQAGYVRVIDEQLGILVEHVGETVLQVFDSGYSRCVVDIRLIPRSTASAGHSCGIVIRYQDPANYYAVEIRTDGFIRLCRMCEGTFEAMSSWRQTNGLRYGEENALRVVLPGNRVIAYVNGRKVLDEPEVSFVDGGIGVFAKSYTVPGAWCAFDDVTIRHLDRNIVLDPRSQQTREIEQFERIGLVLLSGAASFVSAREGLVPLAYGLVAFSLIDVFHPSTHLLEIR